MELSCPEYNWETIGEPDVNKGPEILKHGNKTFLTYSASHCSTDDHALGMLTASSSADPMQLHLQARQGSQCPDEALLLASLQKTNPFH